MIETQTAERQFRSDDLNRAESFTLLENAIGLINIRILSNEFQETPGYGGERGSYHKIVFQVEEDEPDISAIGILFSLSLMSFTYAAPGGYSEKEFIADEDWRLGYFIHGLELPSSAPLQLGIQHCAAQNQCYAIPNNHRHQPIENSIDQPEGNADVEKQTEGQAYLVGALEFEKSPYLGDHSHSR